MKRIFCGILFFFLLLWGGERMVDVCFPQEQEGMNISRQTEEASAHIDATFNVLLAANHYAEVSVHPTTGGGLLLARRYRPGGFTLDKWFAYLTAQQLVRAAYLFKYSSFTLQRYTAQRQNSGYYVYALRKIIV